MEGGKKSGEKGRGVCGVRGIGGNYDWRVSRPEDGRER